MPNIDEMIGNQKFKKSMYRPWNYMDEMEKEELEKKTKKKTLYSEVFVKNKKTDNDEKCTTDKIFHLSGHQKTLFFFILDLLISRGLLSTGPITSKTMSEIMKTTCKMVKTTIGRLIFKMLIIRENGKTGKGGFYIFRVTEETRNAFLDYKRSISAAQDLKNDKENIDIYVGISNEKEKIASNSLADVSPLIDIGLTGDHIIQLKKHKKLTQNQIQESINHFAFDLAHNNKAKELKKPPLDFFMGILRQGIPYAPPNNYESEEAIAMRLYLESKEVAEKKQKELEDKFKTSLLQEWMDTLSESDLMGFYVPTEAHLENLPEKVQITIKKRNALDHAKQYFDMEIWPSKRKALLSVKSDVASAVDA